MSEMTAKPSPAPLPNHSLATEPRVKVENESQVRLHPRAMRRTPLAGRGEPLVWLTGVGLSASTLMILCLLILVIYNGMSTFWPEAIQQITLTDGTRILGQITRSENYRPGTAELAALPPTVRDRIMEDGGWSQRRLIRTGNYDLYGDDFRWVPVHMIAEVAEPPDAWVIERNEWGRGIAFVKMIEKDGTPLAEGSAVVASRFAALHGEIRKAEADARALEKGELGHVNSLIEEERLSVRRAALKYGEDSPEHTAAARKASENEQELTSRYDAILSQIMAMRARNSGTRLIAEDINGRLLMERPGSSNPLDLVQVVRAFPVNELTLAGKIGVYLDRWLEFLVDEPREANTEGGVFPAIFGTLMMTVMMSVAVAPFGVMAALYLREYAKQGPMVSAVRIAVNNLAGVPSIVYGVFGLGFFCYMVGGTIDEVFFPERLPSPTFGTGGILWASLTLALLTVPVVIVATEEAIAAVPRSMREGSYACGASRWQTIWRIVLPRATPGIMTGLILAMARGAGEVAPLMITGVVKLAPELPFDSTFPFFHLERSFMHLGFHIYDVGFQSRNSEAGKPMVFTTTLLLIGIVVMLNLFAIYLRSRLKRRFKTAAF